MTFRISAIPSGFNAREVQRLGTYLTRRLKITGAVSVSFVSPKRMQELNRIYRGKNTATDVLSFSFANGKKRIDAKEKELGEILLCAREIKARAPSHDMTTRGYFRLLLVHSVLHILGHDHAANADAVRMERKEKALLAGFGVARR